MQKQTIFKGAKLAVNALMPVVFSKSATMAFGEQQISDNGYISESA
ncbi:MAG: hypothetical protein AB2693_32915 [Candidatus Thiodiazotropha sp.]